MKARLTLLFMLITVISRPTFAAIHATRVDGGGRQAWALIAVTFSPQSSDAEVCVQDPRGGPAMVRVAPTGAGMAWVPVPLVAPAQLKGETWPLEVDVRVNGRAVEHASVEVPASVEAIYRVAVPAGTPQEALAAVEWKMFSDKPVAYVPWPALDAEMPPLVFAGCDAVVTTDEAPRDDGLLRAAAALGTRFIRVSGALPATSAGWVWEHAGATTGAMRAWTTPAVTFRPASVIEPGLADLRVTPAVAPAGMKTVAVCVGPAAIIVVLIARGLFRSTRGAFAAATVGMGIVAAGGILCLRAVDGTAAEVTMREVAARPDAAAGAAVVTERVGSQGSYLGRGKAEVAADNGCLYPIAATPRAYFALKGWEVVLRGRATELRGPLAAGQVVRYLRRDAESAGATPPLPDSAESLAKLATAVHAEPTAGEWVVGGYVFPAAMLPGAGRDGTLFTAWAKGQDGPAADAAAAWDALRFDARHRYFVWKAGGGLSWVDYGVAP